MSRLEITRGRWEGNGELLLNGCTVSVWDDEKVLKINSGDGCTTS